MAGMIHGRQLQWGPSGRPLTPPLDLHLAAGSLTGIIGRNGCGKSSLLKLIAGWQAPLAGHLRVDAASRGGIGFLLQQQSFDRQFPISLGDLVASGQWRQAGSRKHRRSRLEQALQCWQLDGLERLPLEALSGGQLQRALLARIDLTSARVLLLDEPEAALDTSGQALFWARTRHWQAEGRTLLVASHGLEHLQEHMDSALLVSTQGCVHAPIAEFAAKRLPLEQIA